jgi:ferredoxin-NADP reductase
MGAVARQPAVFMGDARSEIDKPAVPGRHSTRPIRNTDPMTAAELLACIMVALLLQGVAGVAFAVWRRPATAVAPPSASVDEVVSAVTSVTGAWSGWRDFRVVRRAFEDAAQTQCSFHLQPVDGLPLAPFRPGQYLTFSLKVSGGVVGAPGGARTITRCYSLSDRPDATGYRITIKRALAPADRPELSPGMSSGHFHDRVHEGDVLQVKAPSGHFFIDPDAGVPAVFIAGGIGITPMMSMLRWCMAEQPERPVHLYYGVRSSGDQAFKRVLEDLAAARPAFKLNVVYSNPGADDLVGRDYQHLGHIDLALLRRTVPHGRHQFYVCGPPPMMHSLVPALREWGVQAGDIHFEAFGPASVRPTDAVSRAPAAASSASINVRFSRAGRTLIWDAQDANLLDFAERHGVAVDSGCRSGSCGACQTRLLSGVVTYADKPDHDIPKGHCLLCVGKPQAALVLDA